jgi:flagellar biosynthesis protein FlhB
MAEKTEAPTPARIRRAIAEGDVTVSAVATRWVALALGVLLLPTALSTLAIRCLDLFKRGLTAPNALTGAAFALLHQALSDVAWVLLPWLAALAVGVTLATLLQTRGALKRRSSAKNAERAVFSLSGLRLFDGAHWGTLLVALCGAAATAALGVYLTAHHLQSFANAEQRPVAAAPLCFTVVNYLVAAALGVGLCAAAADFFIRAAARKQRLRMTRAEWLEDQRVAHGDSAVRSERQRRASTP